MDSAAVDAAADGDTIRIAKEPYPEFVQIVGRSDLTLVGVGKPVLVGTGVPGLAPAGRLATLGCTDVVVKGLVSRNNAEDNSFSATYGV